ncbi:TolC family protein [Bdellovibrionota bacterium FG-1]
MKIYTGVFYLSVFLCSLSSLAVPVAAPISLNNAYRAALQLTETTPIGQSRINQTEARVKQVRAKFLPVFSLGSGYQQLDNNNSSSVSYTRLTLSQSIYEGGRDRSSLESAKALRQNQEQNLWVAQYAVFTLVARNYYAILSSERETTNIRKASLLANDRATEISNRVDIGRAKKVELLAAQAQVSVLESQLMAAEGQLITVKEQFGLITGLGKHIDLAQPSETIRAPGSVDSYLSLLEKRPDIAAMKAQIEAAQKSIGVVQAGHLPALSITGDYYVFQGGTQKSNNWDAGLYLSFPIFSGGAVLAQVTEFSEREKEVELTLSQTRREAEIEIRNAYNNLVSAVNQIRSLRSALSSTEQNYKEQEKNYRFGQATNLDVIQALNVDLDTRRTLDRTRYQALTSWAELSSATAQVPMLEGNP